MSSRDNKRTVIAGLACTHHMSEGTIAPLNVNEIFRSRGITRDAEEPIFRPPMRPPDGDFPR